MADRLLTKEERDEVVDTGNFRTIGEERIGYCKVQDAKTLKAVGEWLDKRSHINDYCDLIFDIKDEEIDMFLRGEMPGG